MTNLRTDRAEEVRFVDFRASDDADGQTLEGYAAVFNAWTDISDRMGTYKERIAPGAFKRSLGQRTPVLQFDHGSHPMFGSLPLGSISVLREDRNGLFVRAKLSDNWFIQPIRDAIKDGGLTGMSFRFRVISDDWDTEDGEDARTIKEVELLELGPVVFPAYEQTSVAVRSLVDHLDDELRDDLAEYFDELKKIPDRITTQPVRSTSDVASEPADSDSPDEPPVESHEDPRSRIAAVMDRKRHHRKSD